jgi:hypothetical protein
MWLKWFDPPRRIVKNLPFHLPRVSPAAIKSWVRCGGPVLRGRLVLRCGLVPPLWISPPWWILFKNYYKR